MHIFPELLSAPSRNREGSREPSGFSDRGLRYRRRLIRSRDRTPFRKGHRARGARSRPPCASSPRRTAAIRVQVRTARRGRPARVRGPHRHRRAKHRAPAGSRRSSSRSSCRSPGRHDRDRTRLEPSAHGAGIAGRHGGPRGRRGNVRRGGWAAVRRRASRRTASTRTCPPSASRFRRPSMTASRCAGDYRDKLSALRATAQRLRLPYRRAGDAVGAYPIDPLDRCGCEQSMLPRRWPVLRCRHATRPPAHHRASFESLLSESAIGRCGDTASRPSTTPHMDSTLPDCVRVSTVSCAAMHERIEIPACACTAQPPRSRTVSGMKFGADDGTNAVVVIPAKLARLNDTVRDYVEHFEGLYTRLRSPETGLIEASIRDLAAADRR